MIDIYVLIDPRDGIVKYVGQTKNYWERLKKHKSDFRDHNPRTAWLKKLKRLGLEPSMVVFQRVEDDKANEAEIAMIKLIGRGGTLKNMTIGGEGRKGPLSEETKRKLSIAGKGRIVSQETRDNMSMAAKMRDCRLSEEAKKKIGDANRGRKHNETARIKMSLAHKGVGKSEEHKRKISESNKGRIFSDETKYKMSLAKTGWKPPASTTAIQKLKCRGEGNGRAKLSENDVIRIMQRFDDGEINRSELAREYKVSPGVISRIILGQSWKHLQR